MGFWSLLFWSWKVPLISLLLAVCCLCLNLELKALQAAKIASHRVEVWQSHGLEVCLAILAQVILALLLSGLFLIDRSRCSLVCFAELSLLDPSYLKCL